MRLPDEQITPQEEVERFEFLRLDPWTLEPSSVVAINEEECRYSAVTGGKGSSLAALHALSEQLETVRVVLLWFLQ